MKLSIVTVTYNDLLGLEQTLKSVFSQTFKDFEHIIIDGGSKDGSVDLITKNKDRFSYWISEPDNGVFNAMNKGIQHTEGEYLLMLNSGDVLHDEYVLQNIFNNCDDVDLIYGDVFREAKGEIFAESIFVDKLTFDFMRYGMISHQAAFIKRSVHNIVGMYDESLKFCADWKFFILAICRYNITYQHLYQKVAVCNCEGLTTRPQNFVAMKMERDMVLEKEFPAFIKDYNLLDTLRNKVLNFNSLALKKQVNSFSQSGKNLIKKLIN